ncbi:zinc metalloprotease HtpX [soil metagenome]
MSARRRPAAPEPALYNQVSANKRRSVLLMAGFVAVVVTLAWAASLLFGSGVAGLVGAVVFAAFASLGAWWKSDAIALALSHARPAVEAEHARFHNVVEGLCVAGGLPKPRLFVVPDDAPNAFATGRNPRHAAIVVTTGLLEKLNRLELGGVLAHELSHVKNYDTLVSTLAVTILGLSGTVFMVTAPLGGRLMRVAVGRRRELLADTSGVTLTRYPPGLISALEKLRDDSTLVRSGSRATAHLWIESPVPRTASEGRSARFNRAFDTHPPLEERIAALREL